MLTADQQEEIIRVNRRAFEELALRWRNPQTGEPEPDLDLGVAVRQMVCSYFYVHGWTNPLYSPISEVQKEALKQNDWFELTEEEISAENRAVLKCLCTESNPVPSHWDFDEGTWRWELLLRDAEEDVDAGYVAIIPLKNGHRFKYKLEPPFRHDQWAIIFVGYLDCPTIFVKGPLEEAKRTLDQLLKVPTPEIPNH